MSKTIVLRSVTSLVKALCPAMLTALLTLSPLASAGESNLVRVQFREVDTLFANPGQGWMSQQRSPRGEPRFPCSVVYIRFNWADVEPEEGKFNWKLIDDVIAAWKPRGAAVAMRVMTCNAHSSGYYTSPKWLFDAGCKGFEYLVGGDDPTSGGKRIPRIEPDYADPIYLEKHGAFLKALGERYDGQPGRGVPRHRLLRHLGRMAHSTPAPVAVRKQIVDLYLRAFRKTPLVFMSDDAEVLNYALAHGTGFRRDGVGSPWHEQNWIGSKKYAGVAGMADTWKRAPVVFEWFGDYDYLQSRQWSVRCGGEFHAQQPRHAHQRQHRPRAARGDAATGETGPPGRRPLRPARTGAREDRQTRRAAEPPNEMGQRGRGQAPTPLCAPPLPARRERPACAQR